MSDSELYGDDIRLWVEIQSALLRRFAAGETVIAWRQEERQCADHQPDAPMLS